MGLLEGKNALVFGLANERSIAWGITQAFKREGANIGISYAGEMLEKRVRPLAEKIDCKWVEQCDVTSDEQISAVAESAANHFGKIDVLVHSIAFAGRDELSRPTVVAYSQFPLIIVPIQPSNVHRVVRTAAPSVAQLPLSGYSRSQETRFPPMNYLVLRSNPGDRAFSYHICQTLAVQLISIGDQFET
jgi:enoyl-[acyl-carrier protein] reductase I